MGNGRGCSLLCVYMCSCTHRHLQLTIPSHRPEPVQRDANVRKLTNSSYGYAGGLAVLNLAIPSLLLIRESPSALIYHTSCSNFISVAYCVQFPYGWALLNFAPTASPEDCIRVFRDEHGKQLNRTALVRRLVVVDSSS